MWHRVATNPKPEETDGLLDFGVDFLNRIPIQWSVLGAVLILGAIYYGARSSHIPSPVVRGAGEAADAGPSQAYDRSAARAAAARRGRWRPPPAPWYGWDVSTTAEAPPLLPAGPRGPAGPAGGGRRWRSAAASPTTTCARATAAATSWCGSRARTRRCSASTARCEREATAAAAAAGVGPEVVAYLDEPPTLVTEFLPGRVMTQADLGKPDMIAEVAVTLWEVHGMRRAAQPLLGLGHRRPLRAAPPPGRGGGAPGAFGDLREGARRIQAAIDPAHPEHAPVPCHNDLLPANLIHDGEAIRIVDWEYAGMGNRYFDLGNLSVNNAFNEAGDEWLLECYWGEPCTRAAAARRCG